MRRRRWMIFSVLLLAVSLVAAGCGDDDEEATDTTEPAPTQPSFEAGTTMAAIQSKGKLVVGTKFNQLGSGLKNPTTGELEGFDIEIAKLMAVGIFGGTVDDVESKIEFKEAVTAVREAVIQSGEVDMVVATYTINDRRKQQVDFAGPYLIDGQDVMVKSDNNAIRTLTDLNGKKVCTGRGSTTPANLEAKNITADLTLFETYPECATALRQDRVEAVVTDRGILLGLVDQSDRQFKLANINVSEEPLGIGLKKGDDAFREFLNDRLEAIFASGQWAAAYERTLGRLGLPTPEPPQVDRYASTGTETTLAATTTTAAAGGTTTTAAGGTTTTVAGATATTVAAGRGGGADHSGH
ncbi:MAG TPA: glutamate ABC transporter substrate-binding protein [Acidimicrobiales bacterium]|nr:glutamate ABC transporter substrate-binding protein [Acidimicrobiales bacterium]